MFCGRCGAQIKDGAKFCQNCGAPVGGQPAMGQQPMGQQPMGQQPRGQQSMGQQPTGQQSMGQPTGAFVRQVGKVNIFHGAGAIGVTFGAGFLYIFDDRLELQKTAGTSAGYGISPVAGLAISIMDKKSNPMDVWLFRDIDSIYSAKHAGTIPKFVVKFKNKSALSFTLAGVRHAAPQIEELVGLMQQLLGNFARFWG